MADRLDILSQRLIERLEERRGSPGPQCLSTSRLGAYLAGDLSSDEWDNINAHLDSCLPCLQATTQLKDLLNGITAPVPLRDNALMTPQSLPHRIWTAIRGSLEWRAPVGWGLAGALAGVALTLLVINVTREQTRDIIPPEIILRGFPRGITPSEIQSVIGVVSSVKQGTEEGMTYYVIRMKGDNDNIYQIFFFGESEIQANDRILVDEIVELQPSDPTGKVYSGVAKGISKLDQPE